MHWSVLRANLDVLEALDNMNITAIGQKLQVSYDVINQLILQSYKSVMNTPVVFEAQERIRLGLG
jgi:hypothetical protein